MSSPPDSRDRILDAAARVYAEFGFRGATTRRIALAAGVNEVTLFRTFGSKAALIDEALRCRAHAGVVAPHQLPPVPVHPERELTAWAAAHLHELRAARALIRKAWGEMEAQPQIGPCVASGWSSAGDELRRYMMAMGERGFVDWSTFGAGDGDAACGMPASGGPACAVDPAGDGTRRRNEHAFAAGTMLMAALFSDAMGRDVMPELYPQPADRAPALYVRLFLRVIGCRAPAAGAPGGGPAADAPRPRRAPRPAPRAAHPTTTSPTIKAS